MRKVFLLFVILWSLACTEPLKVTGKTDQQATTSGTLGSVKANNQMPDRTIDSSSVRKADSTLRRGN
jgi:hypothetical protein